MTYLLIEKLFNSIFVVWRAVFIVDPLTRFCASWVWKFAWRGKISRAKSSQKMLTLTSHDQKTMFFCNKITIFFVAFSVGRFCGLWKGVDFSFMTYVGVAVCFFILFCCDTYPGFYTKTTSLVSFFVAAVQWPILEWKLMLSSVWERARTWAIFSNSLFIQEMSQDQRLFFTQKWISFILLKGSI